MIAPRCRSCGRPLDRRANERNDQFSRRRICSMRACTGQGVLQPDFPGAIPAATVPPRCPRCGGLWRAVEEGVACLLCGHRVHVVEALIARARQGWVDERATMEIRPW
jgi:hypothetical protein